jgi:hypothetical protein
MYERMRTSLHIAEAFCVAVLLLLQGCGPMSQSSYLASYDREISSSTQAIETARDDAAVPRHIPSEAALIRRKPAIAGLSS